MHVCCTLTVARVWRHSTALGSILYNRPTENLPFAARMIQRELVCGRGACPGPSG